MNIEQELKLSICKLLENEIEYIKNFWKKRDKPAFIRVEGGHIRPYFISRIAVIDDLSNVMSAELDIERLIVPAKQKKAMLETLNRMLPGTALILLDSDSADEQARTHTWFIT